MKINKVPLLQFIDQFGRQFIPEWDSTDIDAIRPPGIDELRILYSIQEQCFLSPLRQLVEDERPFNPVSEKQKWILRKYFNGNDYRLPEYFDIDDYERPFELEGEFEENEFNHAISIMLLRRQLSDVWLLPFWPQPDFHEYNNRIRSFERKQKLYALFIDSINDKDTPVFHKQKNGSYFKILPSRFSSAEYCFLTQVQRKYIDREGSIEDVFPGISGRRKSNKNQRRHLVRSDDGRNRRIERLYINFDDATKIIGSDNTSEALKDKFRQHNFVAQNRRLIRELLFKLIQNTKIVSENDLYTVNKICSYVFNQTEIYKRHPTKNQFDEVWARFPFRDLLVKTGRPKGAGKVK